MSGEQILTAVITAVAGAIWAAARGSKAATDRGFVAADKAMPYSVDRKLPEAPAHPADFGTQLLTRLAAVERDRDQVAAEAKRWELAYQRATWELDDARAELAEAHATVADQKRLLESARTEQQSLRDELRDGRSGSHVHRTAERTARPASRPGPIGGQSGPGVRKKNQPDPADG